MMRNQTTNFPEFSCAVLPRQHCIGVGDICFTSTCFDRISPAGRSITFPTSSRLPSRWNSAAGSNLITLILTSKENDQT
jgi:hypothetical protein